MVHGPQSVKQRTFSGTGLAAPRGIQAAHGTKFTAGACSSSGSGNPFLLSSLRAAATAAVADAELELELERGFTPAGGPGTRLNFTRDFPGLPITRDYGEEKGRTR